MQAIRCEFPSSELIQAPIDLPLDAFSCRPTSEFLPFHQCRNIMAERNALRLGRTTAPFVRLARQNSQLLHERRQVEAMPARLDLVAFKVRYPTRTRCLLVSRGGDRTAPYASLSRSLQDTIIGVTGITSEEVKV